MTVKTVVVDDHRVVTRSLKAFLESFSDLEVVAIATSGEELLDHLDDWKPDVIVQDLLMPGGIDGIETTREALRLRPDVRVIALTASMDEARMCAVLRAGAAGYLRKDAEPEMLVAAIRTVARGGTLIDSAAGKILTAGSCGVDDLTPREIEVLRQMALGHANKEIAHVLRIGEETVKSHAGNIFGKLQVENRSQAIVQALRRGLVSLDDIP